MIKDILLKFGLSDREAEIYLRLSEYGSLRASQLAKDLKLPKTTVIEALYLLEEKGLVSRIKQKNSFIFTAEDPEILLLQLDKKEQEIQANKALLIKALPAFRTIKSDKNIPKVRYFEGREGIIQLYEDSLRSKSGIYAYGSSEDELRYLPEYFPEYWNRRVRAGIPITTLMPDTDRNKKHSQDTDAVHLRKSYLFPEAYRTPLEIDVYDNKVVLMSFKEWFGVMIESAVIASAMSNLLKLARDGTKND
jgi:sugar-specific transcriptional regulator TrmB